MLRDGAKSCILSTHSQGICGDLDIRHLLAAMEPFHRCYWNFWVIMFLPAARFLYMGINWTCKHIFPYKCVCNRERESKSEQAMHLCHLYLSWWRDVQVWWYSCESFPWLQCFLDQALFLILFLILCFIIKEQLHALCTYECVQNSYKCIRIIHNTTSWK